MAKELRKLLELILNDDWHDLLMYLTMDEIKANYIKTSSEDYGTGDDTFEWLARRTYPNRIHLIKTVIEKVLRCKHKNTVSINEEGHAGVFCTECGKQLEKEC